MILGGVVGFYAALPPYGAVLGVALVWVGLGVVRSAAQQRQQPLVGRVRRLEGQRAQLRIDTDAGFPDPETVNALFYSAPFYERRPVLAFLAPVLAARPSRKGTLNVMSDNADQGFPEGEVNEVRRAPMERSRPGHLDSDRGVAPYPPESSWRMPVLARRLLLLAPPLLLAGWEVAHPQPDANIRALMDASTWFAAFHGIQLILIGLVAVSVLLLADAWGRASSWATRIGVGLFLVFYSAYDSVAGIATGLAMRSARDLSPAQQEGVFAVVKDWPGFSAPFALSILGTLGWVVAVGSLALAARRLGAPRAEWIMLGLAALCLMGGHPFPAGTLAFGSFFVAALVHETKAGRADGHARRPPGQWPTEH